MVRKFEPVQEIISPYAQSKLNNDFKYLFEMVNTHGKTIQDLVADGQLTEEQYAELLRAINSLVRKGEIKLTDIDKNNFKLDQTYLADELLQQIAGTAEINAVPADDSITRRKMADKSITPEKTIMFNSENIFNASEVEHNKSIDVDGNIIDEDGRWLSGIIPVSPDETLSITPASYRNVYYDENLEPVTGRGGMSSTPFTTTTFYRARYMRISGNSRNLPEEVMMNRGSTLKPFERYGELKREFTPPVRKEDIPEIEDNSITPEKTTFINQTKNLFNRDEVLEDTSMTDTGEVVEDSGYWLGNLIPVNSEEVFSVTPGQYRILYYDKDGEFYTRSGINTHDTEMFTAIRNATIAYFRLSGSMLNDYEKVVVNKGDVLHEWDEFQRYKLDKDLIDYKTSSSSQPIDEEKLESEVLRLMDHPAPSIPSLNFATVRIGWDFIKTLSRDGEIVFGARGSQLLQSKDEFETLEEIGQPIPAPTGRGIAAVRELYDGELILSIQRNEDENERGKVYKTVGYDRDNPADTTFKQVLELNVDLANVQNNWGMSVYNNIVLVSEYGLRGEQGARFVYLSEDHGETFTPIFDQMTTTAEIEGAPEWTESGHLHTVEYDPYWNRIWLVVGDNPNSATYYSDDMGDSWVFVEGSTEVQYTGIKALPDVVIFGSDRNPNGVHYFVRKNKSDMPVIKPLLLLNDLDVISHVFQKAYKRDWHPKTPTYFASTSIQSTGEKSVIIGTVNGKKAFTLWESGNNFVGNVSIALGPTKQGNILTQISEDGLNGRRIAKAPAPEWE